MKKIIKIAGVMLLVFTLVTNLQYSLLNYNIVKGHSLQKGILAQIGGAYADDSSGDSSSDYSADATPGDWTLQGCPSATVISLQDESNNSTDCSCTGTKKRHIGVNVKTGEAVYESDTYTVAGIQNTCKRETGKTCAAFACSTSQTTQP